MVARHILFAGLFATASLANAALVEPAAAGAPQAAWALNAGAQQTAPSDAFQVMTAGPGNWTGHSRRGDRGATSTMLFSQKSLGSAPQHAAAGSMPAQAAAPVVAAQVVEAAPVAAAPAVAAPVVAAAPVAAAPEVAAAIVAAPVVLDAPAAPVAIDTAGLVNPGFSIAIAPIDNVGGAVDVPEPATGLLMLAGLLGAGAMTRRRK